MPLSDHEENQLRKIEEQFYADDPSFAEKLGLPTMGKTLRARAAYGVILILLGLGSLLLAVALPNTFIGIAAFICMLAGSIVIYNTWKAVHIAADSPLRFQSTK